MLISEEEFKNYLGLDAVDEMIAYNLRQALAAGGYWLTGAVGNEFPPDDPRARQLVLMAAAEFYENRQTTAAANLNKSRLVCDLLAQLRTEAALERGE